MAGEVSDAIMMVDHALFSENVPVASERLTH